MNVFITGSSGKVGGAVASFLISKKVKCYLSLRNNKLNIKDLLAQRPSVCNPLNNLVN